MLIKKVNFVKLWLKLSNFQSSVNKLRFLLSEGPTNEIRTPCFVEMNLFMIFVRVKCILPHCTTFQPKQLIRHKFLKGEFSKSSQR